MIHRFPVRVYYEDTDFSGVVYHASYLRFMERGRTEMLRELGFSQAALSASAPPLAFVVRAMTIGFHKPALMDDLLEIETRATEIGGATLRMAQRILRSEEALVTADVRIAALSGRKPARMPQTIRAIFMACVKEETLSQKS